MNRLALIFIAILVLALDRPLIVAAQTNQSGQSSQQGQTTKPATPAQPVQPSPAQTPTPNTATANSPTAPAAAKPKKTWTNEDLGSLRKDPAISTFNTPNPAKPHPNPAPAQGSRNAKWYRTEIGKLQAQIPPLDDKISKLRAAMEGKQVDEVRHYTWSKPDDWRDQLARLEKQREDIEGKISALQDEARHRGIPADQLP